MKTNSYLRLDSQSNVVSPGTREKSTVFLVKTVIWFEIAIDAIRKSIVPIRTFWDRKSLNALERCCPSVGRIQDLLEAEVRSSGLCQRQTITLAPQFVPRHEAPFPVERFP
jgi:hypothetical protein